MKCPSSKDACVGGTKNKFNCDVTDSAEFGMDVRRPTNDGIFYPTMVLFRLRLFFRSLFCGKRYEPGSFALRTAAKGVARKN